MVTFTDTEYRREVLTGKTSYREGLFGRLILTVEVKEQTAYGTTFYGLTPAPAPVHYTAEQKNQWDTEQRIKTESSWTTVRTFYRDARKADMVFLAGTNN